MKKFRRSQVGNYTGNMDSQNPYYLQLYSKRIKRTEEVAIIHFNDFIVTIIRLRISENDYKTKESKHFLEKIYNNLIKNMVATLYSNEVIQNSDIEELRKFLNDFEDKEQ